MMKQLPYRRQKLEELAQKMNKSFSKRKKELKEENFIVVVVLGKKFQKCEIEVKSQLHCVSN